MPMLAASQDPTIVALTEELQMASECQYRIWKLTNEAARIADATIRLEDALSHL